MEELARSVIATVRDLSMSSLLFWPKRSRDTDQHFVSGRFK
jgi:hypothetical protein